jgi:hypothetical protein
MITTYKEFEKSYTELIKNDFYGNKNLEEFVRGEFGDDYLNTNDYERLLMWERQYKELPKKKIKIKKRKKIWIKKSNPKIWDSEEQYLESLTEEQKEEYLNGKEEPITTLGYKVKVEEYDCPIKYLRAIQQDYCDIKY